MKSVFRKRIFSLIYILLLANPGVAQPENFNLPYQFITLKPEKHSGSEIFNFSKITILDARADTSKIGFRNSGLKINIYRLNIIKGVATGVSDYLNDYYKESFNYTKQTLFIVIKKLWLSNYDTIMKLGNNLIYSGDIYSTKLKLEFYLKNENNYYPIKRIDTSFISLQYLSTKGAGFRIMDGMINSCNTLFMLDTTAILKRKKYTLDQINEFNTKDHSILKASKFEKGVYTTFNEFLNNSPSQDYINVDVDKYGDVLYLSDGKGGNYATNKFWGYSDGKNIYITSAKNFFRLQQVQNTFEFYGIKNLRERFNYRGEFLHKRKPALDMFIYQVDMETGETY